LTYDLLTLKLDLDGVKMNNHASRRRSKVISFESYRLDTHKQTKFYCSITF